MLSGRASPGKSLCPLTVRLPRVRVRLNGVLQHFGSFNHIRTFCFESYNAVLGRIANEAYLQARDAHSSLGSLASCMRTTKNCTAVGNSSGERKQNYRGTRIEEFQVHVLPWHQVRSKGSNRVACTD
jgi:hypothetical protein